MVNLQLYDICDGEQVSFTDFVGIAQLSDPIINAQIIPATNPVINGIIIIM